MKKTLPLLILLVLGIALGIAVSQKPWQVLEVQNDELKAQKQEMAELERRRTKLTREEAKVSSPVGQEQVAREMGFRRQAETPLVSEK